MNKKKTNKSTQTKKTKKGKNLTSELQETKDKYLRLYSEFENYRRRTSKEKIEMIHSANKDLLKDILPVIDDYERAVKANKENEIEGFSLIFQKLKTTLEKYNVKKMEIKKGDDFDSELHEAITSSPSDKKLKGKIIDIIEDGYHVSDSILRFAKVVTGS